jgi:N-carbamoyl-L-amino-acid hydrolase
MRALRIDARRFERDFGRLYEIGATGDGGVHRPALGENHLEARRWFRERIVADGLEFREDGAGNHGARLSCGDPDAPTLLLGSHLDSVPSGGRFDGTLGVLAAYETVRTVRDAGIELPVHLEAIDFTDEEGTLVGLLGSRALAGTLGEEELDDPRGGAAVLEQGLLRAGLSREGLLGARREPASLAGFLELHIEQGPRLTAAGAAIGVVRSIVGIGSFALRFGGRADHAGTTPMDQRRDAGLGAASLMLQATEMVRADFDDCVVNFGVLGLSPGAYNIVPAAADLALEFRAPDDERLHGLESALLELCRDCAHRLGLDLDVRQQIAIPPVPCAAPVQRAFVAACEALDLPHISLTSGAGHDTGSLAAVCPAGMIFIPSTGGSHSPREFADWEACVNGANTLLLAALRLAEKGATP